MRSTRAEPALHNRVSTDVRERLARCAAVGHLAPSKHNSQPWRFVVRPDGLEVWADPMRVLADTDPHRRELFLSCGAAVHLANVAIRDFGHEAHTQLLPDGPGGPVAVLREGRVREPTDDDRALLVAAFRRHTDRGALDALALPPELPFRLQSEAAERGATLHLVMTPGDRATLADLVAGADRRLAQRPRVAEEIASWSRGPGDDRRDGVPSDHTRGPAASYRSEFVQRDFSRPGSIPAQQGPGPDRPLLAVLCTTGDTALDWVTGGIALAAVLLRVTLAGGSASYLNQPCEDPSSRLQLAEQLRLPGAPQLVLRLGAGAPDLPPPPRRDLHEVLFSA